MSNQPPVKEWVLTETDDQGTARVVTRITTSNPGYDYHLAMRDLREPEPQAMAVPLQGEASDG